MFGNQDEFQLEKLNVGCTLKYNNKNWEITEIGEYNWRTGDKSTEYKLCSDSNDIAFLEVELYKDTYELYYSEAITLDEELLKNAIKSERIAYYCQDFYLEETYNGSYKNLTTRSGRENLHSYVFYADKNIVTIEKWGDTRYESFYGHQLEVKDITKINNSNPR